MGCNNNSNINETFIIEPSANGGGVTGGTFNYETQTLTLNNADDTVVNISGFADNYTTGATLINNVVYFDRTDALSAYTLDLNNISIFDTYTTGGTYSNGSAIFTNNSGGTFTVNGFTTPFTGGTVAGLTATTISATTYLGLPTDNNQYLPLSGGTVSGNTYFLNGLTANTFSADTYQGNLVNSISTGVGLSASSSNGNITLINTLPDRTVTLTGSTYISISGTYPNFGVNAINLPDTFTTGFTYTPTTNTFALKRNQGQPDLTAVITAMTGLTVNGTIFGTTVSATTYLNLPLDIRVTGGTYTAGAATFTNNTGGTFTVNGFTTPFTGGSVTGATNFTNGLTANTISATTYLNLPSTSGLYLPLSGGSVTGQTNIYYNAFGVTSNILNLGLDSNNTLFTFGFGNNGSQISYPYNYPANFATATAYNFDNTVNITTAGSGSYQFLKLGAGNGFDVFKFGYQYGNSQISFITGNTGQFLGASFYNFDNNFAIGTTVNAGYKLDVNGSTRLNGNTSIIGNLSATTISATTYLNLPSTTGLYLPLSGGSVSGLTKYQGTISGSQIGSIAILDNFERPTGTGITVFNAGAPVVYTYGAVNGATGADCRIETFGGQGNSGRLSTATSSSLFITSAYPTAAFNPIISANTSTLTWTFNMRDNETSTPSGWGPGSKQSGTILFCDNSALATGGYAAGTGWAVIGVQSASYV